MSKLRYSDGASLKDKKKFAKYLAEDEELIVATGYGATYLRHQFLLYLIFPGLIFLALGGGVAYFTDNNLGVGMLLGWGVGAIVASLKTILLYHSHRYLLTTRRVIIINGYFAVKLTSALFDKITHIEVDQGFIDRVLYHHGNIIVNTAGMNKGEIRLDYIDKPLEFKNLLERLINREREQYGRGGTAVVTLEGELVN